MIAYIPVDEPAKPTMPTYECLIKESKRQNIPPQLILAVMMEENGRPGQRVKNDNKSFDLGPMQINTIWISEIQKKINWSTHKIEEVIASHGCSNVAAGAWILRMAINSAKGNIWTGVGYYHTGVNYKPSTTDNRATKYAQKVYKNYLKIQHLQFAMNNKVNDGLDER